MPKHPGKTSHITSHNKKGFLSGISDLFTKGSVTGRKSKPTKKKNKKIIKSKRAGM